MEIAPIAGSTSFVKVQWCRYWRMPWCPGFT